MSTPLKQKGKKRTIKAWIFMSELRVFKKAQSEKRFSDIANHYISAWSSKEMSGDARAIPVTITYYV